MWKTRCALGCSSSTNCFSTISIGAAEDLVAPESRDAYYAQEKPAIEDFKVTGIAWADNFATADLTMLSKVKMRSVRLGEFDENVPYASHWKFESGQWFWYLPKVSVRETPFGVMKVNADVAEKSNVDLKSMIAKGPTAKTLQQGVGADRASVQLIGNKTQEVKIENKLPGPVTLSTQIVSGTGFDAALRDSDLAGNGKTRLVISRRARGRIQAGQAGRAGPAHRTGFADNG